MKLGQVQSYFIIAVAVLVGVTLISLPEQMAPTPVRKAGPYHTVITTNKEIYGLGETVHAKFLLINEADHPIYVQPITSFTISGNSVNNPKKIACGVFTSYPAGARIEIPEDGNTTFHSFEFNPKYPGEFVIEGFSVKKSVTVTGYKEVSLNSTGISLEVISNQTSIKQGDIVDFYLVIKNDNQYPVKVPVYEKFARSGAPIEKQTHGIMIEWITSHFKVEANSYKVTWTDRRSLRTPGFSLFYMVDGCRASIQLEVTEEENRIFDPVWVNAQSEGMMLFLEPSDTENPTILIKLRNENPYPVRIKPFSPVEVKHDSLENESTRITFVEYFVPFWDIPAYSTRTIYNTEVYSSPTRSPIFFTLYNQTLRYPPEN